MIYKYLFQSLGTLYLKHIFTNKRYIITLSVNQNMKKYPKMFTINKIRYKANKAMPVRFHQWISLSN